MTTATHHATDGELLGQYAASKDQEAFALLVRRHINWVYSSARRITRDETLAEDVTQGVFLALAQKAPRLAHHPNLAGWLFQATQFAARTAQDRERKRKRHEAQTMSQAMSQSIDAPESDQYWQEIRDRLDRAVALLAAKDRQIILLRFYQQLSHGEMGHVLGIPEETARMRVARALARLRQRLGNGTDGLLSAVLLTNSVSQAPAHLTAAVVGGSHAAGAAAISKSIHLLRTATKIKIAAAGATIAVVALATGSAIQYLKTNSVAPAIASSVPTPLTVPIATAAPATAPAETPWITEPLKRGQPFQGWVHRTDFAADGTVSSIGDWNTKTGTLVARNGGPNQITDIAWLDPETNEYREYSLPDAVITINRLSPGEIEEYRAHAQQALTYPEVLTYAGLGPGQQYVQITEGTERGMKRLDLSPINPLTPLPPINPSAYIPFRLSVPATILIDPESKLIREVQIQSGKTVFTYGAPEITSIYDAGAPRDAKIKDCRPTPQTEAVFQRVEARMFQPFPDGVIGIVTISSSINPTPDVSFAAYQISGNKEERRAWDSRRVSLIQEDPEKLTLPADWAGADALFRRFATVMPERIFQSDGHTGWISEVDPVTGEQFHTWTQIQLGNGRRRREIDIKLPGPETITGRKLLESLNSATRQLYTGSYYGDDRFIPGNTAEIATDPDRPGQIALHLILPHGGHSPPEEKYYWFDAAHNDCPVTYIDTDYQQDPATPGIRLRYIVQFSDFAVLPAPDGRTYPTRWTQTYYVPDASGQLQPRPALATTTFHFFPGKTLPPLPKPQEPLP